MIAIYKITSPSGKIYIGQSIHVEKRQKYYDNINNIKKQRKLYYSFLKYGSINHKFEIIEECTVEQLNERETYWKQHYLNKVNGDWEQVLFCGLYDIGGGPKSDEWKKNIGIANSKPKPKGFMSDNLKQKLSKIHTGKKHKPHKKKNEHKNYGKPKPEGFSELLSSILKGKQTKPGVPIIQLNKNEDIIQLYDSCISAEKITGIKGIYNVLAGRAKTAGGFIWRRQEK
jgi:group I intron endonuclease